MKRTMHAFNTVLKALIQRPFYMQWAGLAEQTSLSGREFDVAVKPLEFPNFVHKTMGKPSLPRPPLKLLGFRQREMKFCHMNTSAGPACFARMRS